MSGIALTLLTFAFVAVDKANDWQLLHTLTR